MIVGSFTSISLDPPLVGFFPAKASRTWQAMKECKRFCVNILQADQSDICKHLSRGTDDRMGSIAHHPSPFQQPIINGALAWIDCTVDRVEAIGDHWLVIGLVEALEIQDRGKPLLFFDGQFRTLLDQACDC